MVDDEVETSLIMVPPLIIQPLIENSIKHGILPRQSVDSKIIVKVFEVDDILYIQVKDNGIGFNNAGKKKDPNHESYGLGNIKSRLQQLSVILGKKIDFYFSEELEGEVSWTVATIEIAI
jgi:sensor histidine kinase YesM